MNDVPKPAGTHRPLRPGLRARRLRRRLRRAARRRRRPTRRSAGRSARSRTSSTAAPRAPTPRPATAPGSSCRSRIRSSRAEVDGLPEPGRYGVGVVLPPPRRRRAAPSSRQLVERTVADEGQRFLGWRDVPVDLSQAGTVAAGVAPRIRQAVIGAADGLEGDAFERKLYVIRRVAELAAGPDLVVPSLSSRTLVYKGMLTAPQLERFYLDLADPRVETALALVHSRYSTNTFPSWELAHPYRADRAQRRDQHAARQRQLDARARVAARVGALRRRPREGAAGDPARRLRHRRRSTTCSSCSCSPAARCRTR